MKSKTFLSAGFLDSGKENFNAFLLLFSFFFSTALFAQNEAKEKKVTVPSAVRESFQKEFPNKKAEWGMEIDAYEAEFKLNGAEASAVYDKSGHRKELEIEIKQSELPVAILDYLKKNYPSGKITEAAKITDAKNTVTYEAEISQKSKKQDVIFDVSGKFLKINDAE